MTQTAINFAKAIYQQGISIEVMNQIRDIIEEVPCVAEVLESPIVSRKEKHLVIERIFPSESAAFLKLLCDYHRAEQLQAICQAYESEYKKKHHLLLAEVFSAQPLSMENRCRAEEFVKRNYPQMQCQMVFGINKKLLGGTLIKVGNEEFDNSYQGRLHQLEQTLTRR